MDLGLVLVNDKQKGMMERYYAFLDRDLTSTFKWPESIHFDHSHPDISQNVAHELDQSEEWASTFVQWAAGEQTCWLQLLLQKYELQPAVTEGLLPAAELLQASDYLSYSRVLCRSPPIT